VNTDAAGAGAAVLVTGGTSGIGRETVRLLAGDATTVLVHGRDRERGERVCETVRRETPGEAHFFAADFADVDAVRELAAAVSDDVDGLDALVNNAGTWQGERRLVDATGERSDGSRAGVECTTAVNHCAHFLLTAELWEELVADGGGRVVTVASALHRGTAFDVDALLGPEGPSGQTAYAHSKLANVLFARELARRAAGTGVTSNSCHPGIVPGTDLARNARGPGYYFWKAFGAVGRVLPFGPVTDDREEARTQYYLASDPAVADVTGAYFADLERTTANEAARSEANAERLWEWTADVVGVDPTFARAVAAQSSSG